MTRLTGLVKQFESRGFEVKVPSNGHVASANRGLLGRRERHFYSPADSRCPTHARLQGDLSFAVKDVVSYGNFRVTKKDKDLDEQVSWSSPWPL